MADRLTRRAPLLDWFMACALLGPLGFALYRFDGTLRWSFITLIGSLAASLVCWILWRRSGGRSRTMAVLFAVAATMTWYFGGGPSGLGMVWLATVVVFRSIGRAAGPVYILATVALASSIYFVSGYPPERVIVETLGSALLAAFGLFLAMLLDRSERDEAALERAREAELATLERLETANAQLRAQLGVEQQLVLAQERERVSHGLHDALGHRLTAAGLSLEYALSVRDRDPDRAWHEVETARETVGGALAETRRIVRAMNPVEFDELRGAEAFGAVADAFRSSGLDVEVRVSGGAGELPRATLLTLLGFVQEGLTNVVRHSEASRARLEISSDATGVVATLTDDGRRAGALAAEDGENAWAEGFGLRSLRSRAEALGGSFGCGPGERGFTIRMTLPVGEQEAE